MERFLSSRPTPDALTSGRRTMVMVAIIVVGVALFILATPGATDAGWLAVLAATIVTVVGHGIAYLGQPTLTRYRTGLVLIGLGIVVAFFLLIVEPFAPATG